MRNIRREMKPHFFLGSSGPTEKEDNKNTEGYHFSIAVLKHSNATPFERRRGRTFRCIFNCYEDFEIPALRDHTSRDHTSHMHRAAKGQPKSGLRVDITNLQCTLCDVNVPDLESLERHFNTIHGISTYKNTADVLIPYKLTEGEYQCQLCDKKSEDFPAMDEHMESHFPLNICEVCGRGYMNERRLKTHNIHHAKKKFTCEICNAPFFSEYLKRRHVDYTHKGIGFLICVKCPGSRFKDHKHKLEHMERVHSVKRPTPTCEPCGKVFSTQSALNTHVKSFHQALKPNKCKLCDERFFAKRKLDMHVRLAHTGERLSCSYCDCSYSNVHDLARHIRKRHPDQERRSLCTVCGKPFENRIKLKLHKSEEHATF